MNRCVQRLPPSTAPSRVARPLRTWHDGSAASCLSLRTFDQTRLIMKPDIAERLIEDFERGLLSRRQLATHLIGLGAALAATARAAEASQGDTAAPTFQATGLNHVALNVASVPKSRDWYIKHLGLKVLRESGEENCFLGGGDNDFFLTLFRGEKPGPEPLLLHHPGLQCRQGRREAQGRRSQTPARGQPALFPRHRRNHRPGRGGMTTPSGISWTRRFPIGQR